MKKVFYIILVAAILLVMLMPYDSAKADDPTPTPTSTPTSTSTPTQTLTPTATAGSGAILWAAAVEEIDGDVRDALEVLLEGDPPTTETYIYAVTDSRELSETSWLISLAALDIEGDLDDWNLFTDGVWLGSAVVNYSGSYLAEYYDPEYIGGGSSVVYFPWNPGKKSQYGPRGVHTSWGLYSVDFFGGYNWGGDVMSEAFAATDGEITWYCDDGVQVTIRVHGPAGDMIYAHLQPGNVNLYNGGKIYQRRSLGGLVAGPIQSSNCGQASQPNDQYHLHWGFEPNAGSGGAMMVEGCFLTLSSELWQCGAGQIIGIGGWLMAGSTDTPPDDPDDPDDDLPGDLGGGHIWDGIVNGLYDLVIMLILPLLPNDADWAGIISIFYSVRDLINGELGTANLLVPFLVNMGIPLSIMLVFLAGEGIILILKLYKAVLRLIPVAG